MPAGIVRNEAASRLDPGAAMSRTTPLHDWHVAHGAKMVDFAGWDMPLHYGSQLEEHRTVRAAAGLFDVSHMCAVDVTGEAAEDFLRGLLANDVARLEAPGAALYSCMLNESGGVLDDLIVYRREAGFRVVVNAGTRDADLAWMRARAGDLAVDLRERDDLAMLALQGPHSPSVLAAVLDDAVAARAKTLQAFHAIEEGERFIARTGYTGEDGFEVALPAGDAVALADALLAAGATPAGLGARDTLRLEAGMNLYGQDMDENTTPLETGLAWTVAFEPAGRDFTGRAALERQRAGGVPRTRVGLVLEDRGVLRSHQRVVTPAGDGETTSGSFSPTLGKAIALARVPKGTRGEVTVEIRGKALRARVVRPPFVRDGAARV